MTIRTYSKIATALGAAGVAFAGYLSLTRLTSGICAFNEPCSLFLGYPACYTGLALFAVAFVVSVVALLSRTESVWPAGANTAIGAAGSLFAGRIAIVELAAHGDYALGIPTCAYGFVFFLALFVLSLSVFIKHTAGLHHGTRHHAA